MKRIVFFMMIGLLFGFVSVVMAQDEACPALVEQALASAGELCSQLGRNSVCYGNDNVRALDANQTPLEDFLNVGDQVRVDKVGQLSTAGMNLEDNEWGVALLALQANLPDTLPGQNVIFVVFGDASLTAEQAEEDVFAAPMQAFSLSTGVGDPLCKEAPNDGVLIQSPTGATVNFLVNGIEVEIGSTALLDIRQDEKLWVSNLEGHVAVTSAGVRQDVEVGYKVLTMPGEAPGGYEPYKYTDVAAVPTSLLPEPVEPPFTLSGAAGGADWVDSGIEVEEGRMVTITAYGEINLFPTCEADNPEELDCDDLEFEPDGSLNLGVREADEPPMPFAQTGALIGRVGDDGEPFFVGEGGDAFMMTPEQDGTLQFRINIAEEKVTGGTAEDNTGGFVILVSPVAEDEE